MSTNFINDKGFFKPYHDSDDDAAWSYTAYRKARKEHFQSEDYKTGQRFVIHDVFSFPKTSNNFEEQVEFWRKVFDRWDRQDSAETGNMSVSLSEDNGFTEGRCVI